MNARVPIHDVARLVPAMTSEEYSDLVADIRRNGQLEPIWTYQGAIIDGRHRYRACLSLGLTPKFTEWAGTGSLIEFVVSMNLRRRHLTPTQRGVLGNQLKARLAEESRQRQGQRNDLRENFDANLHQGRSAEIAGRLTGVSPRLVNDVQRVVDHAPELEELMADAILTTNAASAIAALPDEERAPVLDRIRASDRPKKTGRDEAKRAREKTEREENDATGARLLAALPDEDGSLNRQRRVEQLAKAILAVRRGLLELDPEECIAVCDKSHLSDIESLIVTTQRWIGRMEERLKAPIRLVTGGPSSA